MLSPSAPVSTLGGERPGAAPSDLARAAEAFEALFLNMLLKSMRDTVPEGGLFDSQRLEAYQELQDRELAADLARRKSLGIAELIVRQLSPRHAPGAPADSATPRSAAADPGARTTGSGADFKARFIDRLLPAARRHAPKLGQPAAALIAQAALETGWGRAIAEDPRGRSTNTLFGIKTGPGWEGARVRAATHEYDAGGRHRTAAEFRAYRSVEDSVADYVALVGQAPRYQAARSAGDPRSYFESLAAGGYATDPHYARKVLEILDDPALAGLAEGLKKSAPRPSVETTMFAGAPDVE